MTETLIARPNAALIEKLQRQIDAGATTLALSHDEIDEWRNQFDGAPIPVSHLAFNHVPIVEVAP